MMTLLKRLNPAVPSGVLPVLAGTVWGLVGAMLWVRAGGWLTGCSCSGVPPRRSR